MDDIGTRKVAALRGDTRNELDWLLLHELMGTGIGRSAFIKAAIEVFRGMPSFEQEVFTGIAKKYEEELPL